jgi:hypothetical protein
MTASFPLVGFRAWLVHPYSALLHSVQRTSVSWPSRGEVVAECLVETRAFPWQVGRGSGVPMARHAPPAIGCQCGIYAYTSVKGVLEHHPQWRQGSSQLVIGAVLAYGEVEYGDLVIRAARARPLCLTEPACWREAVGSFPARRAMLEAVAEFNGLPLVPAASLTRYAMEFGEVA